MTTEAGPGTPAAGTGQIPRRSAVVVLVTGSRRWQDRATVFSTLDEICAGAEAVLVLEAGDDGAERCAKAWAKSRGTWHQEIHTTDEALERLRSLQERGHPCLVVVYDRRHDHRKGHGTDVAAYEQAGILCLRHIA